MCAVQSGGIAPLRPTACGVAGTVVAEVFDQSLAEPSAVTTVVVDLVHDLFAPILRKVVAEAIGQRVQPTLIVVSTDCTVATVAFVTLAGKR